MATTAINRLANMLGISARELQLEVMPPHLRAAELDREQQSDEAERAKQLAARAEIEKRTAEQAPGIAKKTAAAKAKVDAATAALKLAETEYRLAIGEQQSETFRADSARSRHECELRKLAPSCCSEALQRIQADEEATRKGLRTWESDKGADYNATHRYTHHSNADKVRERLAALRDARETINALPLRFASVVDMEAAIAKLFSQLPTID